MTYKALLGWLQKEGPMDVKMCKFQLVRKYDRGQQNFKGMQIVGLTTFQKWP